MFGLAIIPKKWTTFFSVTLISFSSQDSSVGSLFSLLWKNAFYCLQLLPKTNGPSRMTCFLELPLDALWRLHNVVFLWYGAGFVRRKGQLRAVCPTGIMCIFQLFSIYSCILLNTSVLNIFLLLSFTPMWRAALQLSNMLRDKVVKSILGTNEIPAWFISSFVYSCYSKNSTHALRNQKSRKTALF